MKIVPIPVCIPSLFDSLGCLLRILRSNNVCQFRVSILYTKEYLTKQHLCLTIEGVFILY